MSESKQLEVLIVDDEQDIREIVAGILEDEGHETRTAHDSDSALAAISDRAPRLVINMMGVPKRPEIPVKDFAAAIEAEPEIILPFDPQLFGTASTQHHHQLSVQHDESCFQLIPTLFHNRRTLRTLQAW